MNINTANSAKTAEETKAAFEIMVEDYEYLLASYARFMGFSRANGQVKTLDVYLFCLLRKIPKGTCLPVVSVALSALIENAQVLEHELSKASKNESKATLLSELTQNKVEGLRTTAEWLSNESKTWRKSITNSEAENLLSDLFKTYYDSVSVPEVMTVMQSVQ